MKNMKKVLSLLTMVLFSLALLAGCGGSKNSGGTVKTNDGYGTLMRDGKPVLVSVSHDRNAVYLYEYDEEHELLGKAAIPKEANDESWSLSRFSIYDDGDLQVTLSHDMSESYLYWTWAEDKGYVFAEDQSEFYHSIVLRYPDDYAEEDAFLDAVYEYVGVWLNDEGNPYDAIYIEFDWNGYWILYAADGIMDEGRIQNEPEGDFIYSEIAEDSLLSGAQIEVEGDRLHIAGYGTFTHLVPENDSENGDSD